MGGKWPEKAHEWIVHESDVAETMVAGMQEALQQSTVEHSKTSEAAAALTNEMAAATDVTTAVADETAAQAVAAELTSAAFAGIDAGAPVGGKSSHA